MTDFRLTLTDQDKREELKLKALQSIASSVNWIAWGLYTVIVIMLFAAAGRK